jgi:transmembrane sensor
MRREQSPLERLDVIRPGDKATGLDPMTREAIGWVVRLRSGRTTGADVEAFRKWRCNNSAREAAFADAVRLWRALAEVAQAENNQSEAATAKYVLERPIAWQHGVRLSRRTLAGGALVAGGLAAVFAAAPIYLWPTLREWTADYRTRTGEQRQIALGRDISIRLNTQTSIAVKEEARLSRVELIAGEALIDVHETSRSVLVLAGGGKITTHQAVFNARCLDGRVVVTCVKGSVEVVCDRRLITLGSDEQTTFAAAGPGFKEVVDPAVVTSWERGFLIFRDAPLADVVREINRYRRGYIVVTNEALGRRIVNATFHVNQLDDFFAQVQRTLNAQILELPLGVTFLS